MNSLNSIAQSIIRWFHGHPVVLFLTALAALTLWGAAITAYCPNVMDSTNPFGFPILIVGVLLFTAVIAASMVVYDRMVYLRLCRRVASMKQFHDWLYANDRP